MSNSGSAAPRGAYPLWNVAPDGSGPSGPAYIAS